ncbi:hypothetical protein LTS10_010499 [Elasticomyces elasticus]|nr:hypothetical protein LTS10_010499 [Elasticomyces elasticus]
MRTSLALFITATLSSTSSALKVLSSTGDGAFAFTLSNAIYYSPATAVASGCFGNTGSCTTPDLLPLTVLATNATTIDAEVLAEVVSTYTEIDDVWSETYLESGAIFLATSANATLGSSAVSWINSYGIKYLLVTDGLDVSSYNSSSTTVIHVPSGWDLQPGPYTFSFDPSGNAAVRQAYALHRDNYEAFLFGVTTVPNTTAYAPVELFIPSYQDAWIPVPSRLYSIGDSRPLAGIRVALKDIYDLEGVQTGGGSRSYAEVYPVANATAVSMQKMLDLGVVIVGKTKTSQFAHGADPYQFIDIHYPWNPRGDGYLTAASSSSGSAAAIAGYDWIDMSIGSDTRGSVRKPAALVGSYGIRPTWQSMNLTGVIPLATEMDTAGFFVRDPELFLTVAGLWYKDSAVPVNTSFTSLPSTVLYPVDYFPLNNSAAQAVFDSFLDTLEQEFGMTRRTINISATLSAAESLSPGITNATSFQLSSNRLAEYVSYHEVGIPLIEAWNTTFPGAGYPPLDPNPRAAFARSMNLTEEDYEGAVSIKNEFRDYFLANILRPDPNTCSESIMILDMGTGGLPSYREQALNARAGATSLTVTQVPGGGPSVPSNYLASTAGCPEVGIPIGQVAYDSFISLQEEYIPVNVDLVAAPGCDGMLLEIVRRLTELGVAKEVKTGRTAF